MKKAVRRFYINEFSFYSLYFIPFARFISLFLSMFVTVSINLGFMMSHYLSMA